MESQHHWEHQLRASTQDCSFRITGQVSGILWPSDTHRGSNYSHRWQQQAGNAGHRAKKKLIGEVKLATDI